MKIGVFLVFLLALHHCDAGELILAAAPTQKARPCETSFVATSQRAQDFYQPKASHLCPYLEGHHSADPVHLAHIRRLADHQGQFIMEEDDSWRCKKCYKIASWSHVHCPFCGGHWSKMADSNYTPQRRRARTPTARQVHQDRTDWEWSREQNRSTSRRRSTSNQSTNSNRQSRKNRGRRGRGRGNKNEEVPTYAKPTLPPPWMPNSGNSAAATLVTENTSTDTENYEMAQALREAYPDPKNRPDNVRRVLDKADQHTTKHLTSALHRSTDALDKARSTLRQLQEAQHKHRQSWLRHLKQVMESLEKQMVAFDEQQQDYGQRITNGRRAINTSRREIQRLNTQASLASMPETVIEDDFDETLPEYDKEEKKLRSQVGELLTKCMEMTEERTPIEIESDDEAMDASRKRLRSNEQKDGSASASHGK